MTAAATFCLDCGDVAGFPDSTLDAVAGETPASAATSLMVMVGPVTAAHLVVGLLVKLSLNRFHGIGFTIM